MTMTSLAEGQSKPKPLELSIPLGNDPVARVSIRITAPENAQSPLLLFLSTLSAGLANLGSFVYALPPVSCFYVC